MADLAANVTGYIRDEGANPYRLAPHNVEAEQALLGCDPRQHEAFYRVSDFLVPEHFYEPVPREITRCCGKILRASARRDADHHQDLPARQLLADTPCRSTWRGSPPSATVSTRAITADHLRLALRRNLILIGGR